MPELGPKVKRRSILGRAVRWIGLLALIAGTVLAVDGWRAFGKAASGERRAKMERSPQWKDGRFHNPQPIANDMTGAFSAFRHASDSSRPSQPVAVERLEKGEIDTAAASGLRVTWMGHSTALIEIDGHRVLVDPFWSDRVSPFRWFGPTRWYAPVAALEDLKPVDAVLVSHDHYDHLDYETIAAMKDWTTTFVVPLGVGAHLAYWGVPEERIVELDWWERTKVRDLEIVATPARHASGRGFLDQDETLWAGFALIGPKHRAWSSGDTGLFPGLAEIGQRLGPFDLTMIEAGAYGRWWPDWHLGPEQAVRAHQMVGGRVLLPAHWGLFDLALHGWTEPAERLVVAAKANGVTLLVPRPGQSVEPEAAPAEVERWWPEVPWVSGDQDPIVSSRME